VRKALGLIASPPVPASAAATAPIVAAQNARVTTMPSAGSESAKVPMAAKR